MCVQSWLICWKYLFPSLQRVLTLSKQFFWIIFLQSRGAAIAIHSCCRGHQGAKSSPPFSLQHRQLLLCLLGCAPCIGTMFALGPMEEGFFSLPQRAAAVSLCLLAAIRAGDWSEHICCIGWYDRKVSSHSGINSPSRTSKRPQTNKR